MFQYPEPGRYGGIPGASPYGGQGAQGQGAPYGGASGGASPYGQQAAGHRGGQEGPYGEEHRESGQAGPYGQEYPGAGQERPYGQERPGAGQEGPYGQHPGAGREGAYGQEQPYQPPLTPGGPGYPGAPPYQGGYQSPYQKPRGGGLGTASLVLGIASIFLLVVCGLGVLTAIAGLVIGIVAFVKDSNRGRAVGGIVLSVLALIIAVVFLTWFYSTVGDCMDLPPGLQQRCVEERLGVQVQSAPQWRS
ncbi:DUF4190 domain-containing protein [Streptosporangium sp. NPDC000239]|uniref:DUF4190 domain-containing protein n=1 Tax=Streptosporangium sp. NPDC000239 TaxID=3154248 RepID=UPI0033342B2A